VARRCSLIAVFILCAVLLTSAVPCRAGGWSYKEFALPAISGAPFQPKVCGDWAVALHRAKSGTAYSTVGVVCYDLAKQQVYTIHEGKAVSPCVSGNTIAFSGKLDNIPELRGTTGKRGTWPSCLILFDLPTGASRSPVLKTNSAFVNSISGNLVAYELGCRIYLYNTVTGAQQRISDNQALNRDPDICGDLIVWLQYEDRTMKKSRVLCYRMSTGQTLACSDEYATNSRPNTDGTTIVWSTAAGTTVYDAKKGFVRVIPSAQYPDVSNGVIVYVTGSGCMCGCGSSGAGRGVYGSEVGSVGAFKIGKTNADTPPSIDDRRVVWARGGVVYCADITHVTQPSVSPGPSRPIPRAGAPGR
jgi:hypothetical protein